MVTTSSGTSRVLITGGSGYFGSLLRDRLYEHSAAVRVFDLADANDRHGDVEFRQGDIRSYLHVRAACAGIDTIYHCVAQVPLAKDRVLFDSVNVRGTANLVQAAADAGVRKVVLLSSSAIYGIPDTNPVTEQTRSAPREAYGWAKLKGERQALRLARARGLDLTVIRPRTILGHGRLGIFQLLFDWVAEGRNVYVLGGGANRYQFVHADDLAAACILAAARPGTADYNIGATAYGTMRQSLHGLIRHAKTGSRLYSLPLRPATLAMEALSKAGLAPFAPYHWLMYGRELYFDTTRAREELGWTPQWGNVAMLCQSYDWYLAHRAALRTQEGGSPHRRPVSQGVLALLRRVS